MTRYGARYGPPFRPSVCPSVRPCVTIVDAYNKLVILQGAKSHRNWSGRFSFVEPYNKLVILQGAKHGPGYDAVWTALSVYTVL